MVAIRELVVAIEINNGGILVIEIDDARLLLLFLFLLLFFFFFLISFAMTENLTLSCCVWLLVDLGFSLCDGWVSVYVVCCDLCFSLCRV